MKKVNIKKICIKNKKDWGIFWIFAALIAYAVGHEFNGRINDWLRGIGNPWMTNLNEPQSYGQMIAAVVLLAVVAEVVLFLCRKTIKAKLAVLAAGIIFPLMIVGIYQVHCKLIVSVLWDMEPQAVRIEYDGEEEYLKVIGENGEIIPSSQELQEVIELCRSLKVISDEETLEAYMEWYNSAEEPFMNTDMVILYFPEKYGHSYMFPLRLQDGYVYLWRGYSDKEMEVTFFEDNGITEWLEGRKKK